MYALKMGKNIDSLFGASFELPKCSLTAKQRHIMSKCVENSEILFFKLKKEVNGRIRQSSIYRRKYTPKNLNIANEYDSYIDCIGDKSNWKHGIMVGTSIATACKEAMKLSNNRCKSVHFNFNGILIKTAENSTVDQLNNFYHLELERNHEIYINSDEYKELEKKRQAKTLKDQNSLNKLISELDDIISNEDNLIAWLGSFSYLNDNLQINFNKEEIIQKLEESGYKRNVYTNENFVKDDKNICAKWLIGQALDNLHSGRRVHSMCQMFADDYKVKFLTN
jgi:hypothetical protein